MLFFGPDAPRATGSTLPCLFLPLTGNLPLNIKGCWCLFLLMTKNPLKNIKGCRCLFLLMTKNPLKNIKGCRCLILLMTENPLKNIKRCQCLFLLTTGNTLKISGTKFFRYRLRYHQKYEKFLIPGIPGTGTSTSAAD